MSFRILIMGLPGSGKTTLSKSLVNQLAQKGQTVSWLNADIVREQYNDWDFTHEGRMRQAHRMNTLAYHCHTRYVILDLVAPLQEMRTLISPNLTVWVDTIKESRYTDTNSVFQPPTADVVVTTQDAEKWASIISELLINERYISAQYSESD